MSRKTKKSKATRRKEKLTPATLALLVRIGKNVARLRNQRGWSQEHMAMFGFSDRYWRRMEAGERNLTTAYIARIAEAFGVDPGELFQPLDQSS